VDPKLAQSEKSTHRQVDFPVMAIEHSPEKLASTRRRFQNYFFFVITFAGTTSRSISRYWAFSAGDLVKLAGALYIF